MMNNKLKDAIYGFAVGDALGVPVEFKQRGSYQLDKMVGNGTHRQMKGTWSDDTSMTIATCDSIKEMGGINLNDLRAKFRGWLFVGKYAIDGKVFDVGGTTMKALRDGVGCDDVYSNGNGSLMRVLPLAFMDDVDDQDIAMVSSLTHAHQISCESCVLYVAIARELIAGRTLKSIIREMEMEAPFHRIRSIFSLTEDEIKSTGYVVDTLEAALWAVATTDNYKDAVLKAVNLGDDTDTVAAVAGGLAGIIYGIEGIPEEWVADLRGKDIIDSCLF